MPRSEKLRATLRALFRGTSLIKVYWGFLTFLLNFKFLYFIERNIKNIDKSLNRKYVNPV